MKDNLLKLWIKARCLREEHGQDMVEYALVVGIVTLGATAAMTSVSQSISTMFSTVMSAVDNRATLIT